MSVDVPAFLPDDYIVDTGQRLDIYRRLARARGCGDVDGVTAELRDRYGELPSEAAYYGSLMQYRITARGLGATALELRGSKLTLRWSSGGHGAPPALVARAAAEPGRFKMQGGGVLRIALGAEVDEGARGRLAACSLALNVLATS